MPKIRGLRSRAGYNGASTVPNILMYVIKPNPTQLSHMFHDSNNMLMTFEMIHRIAKVLYVSTFYLKSSIALYGDKLRGTSPVKDWISFGAE